ncbi:MAG: MOSC domain-containing protein [Acidimicrobiales bacterium]
MDGDRRHALLDTTTGRILSAKSVKDLLFARVERDAVVLPDGTALPLDDPGASDALSAWLGRDVRLATPVEGEERSFQMTFDPPNDDAEYLDIPAPAGSFLDFVPVHVVTTATLAGCRARRPDLDWDIRRFRPNLVIDIHGSLFVENGWSGQCLRIGDEAELEVMGPTVRCAMPLRAQPGLDRQAELFRAMSDLNTRFPNHLGASARVRTPGRVVTGDAVTPIRPS